MKNELWVKASNCDGFDGQMIFERFAEFLRAIGPANPSQLPALGKKRLEKPRLSSQRASSMRTATSQSTVPIKQVSVAFPLGGGRSDSNGATLTEFFQGDPMNRPRSFCSSVLLTSALLCSGAAAQLSGAFTIDPAGSGARNFTSFQAAGLRLAIVGVSGPVTITVADGTYREAWNLGPIPGASAKNRVVFKSATRHGAKFHKPSSLATVLTILDYSSSFPVSWIVLDGFEFNNTSTGNLYALQATGSCTDLEIRNCRFLKTGMLVWGLDRAARWQFHHNEIRGFGDWRIQNIREFDFHHNRFEQIANIKIEPTSGGTRPTRFWNNLVSGVTNNRGFGILDFSGGVHMLVEHNTVLMTSVAHRGPCIRVGGRFARPVVLKNNIFASLGSGPVVEFGSFQPFVNVADANIYWAPSAPDLIATLSSGCCGSSKRWKTLADWRKASGVDTNSAQVDPRLNTNLTVQIGSPAVGKALSTSKFITDDFGGNPRFPKPTIGAYEGFLPIRFQAFGTGCPGTGGRVPKIGSFGEHRLGSKDFHVSLTNALGGFGVRAILAIGASNTKWGGVTLPLALGGGCSLRVSPDLLFVFPVSGGTGAGQGTSSFNLAIPNDPKLLGTNLYFQWGVGDPKAGGIGIAFSDGGKLSL